MYERRRKKRKKKKGLMRGQSKTEREEGWCIVCRQHIVVGIVCVVLESCWSILANDSCVSECVKRERLTGAICVCTKEKK